MENKAIGLTVALVIAVILIPVAYYAGTRTAVEAQEMQELKQALNLNTLQQVTCAAEAMQDPSFCDHPALSDTEKENCRQGVYHVQFIAKGSQATLEKIEAGKQVFEAIALGKPENCNGVDYCEAAATGDESKCNESQDCKELYNIITAVKEWDSSYCDKIIDETGKKECTAVLSKDPKICEQI